MQKFSASLERGTYNALSNRTDKKKKDQHTEHTRTSEWTAGRTGPIEDENAFIVFARLKDAGEGLGVYGGVVTRRRLLSTSQLHAEVARSGVDADVSRLREVHGGGSELICTERVRV